MESYFDISNDLKDVWDADIDPEILRELISKSAHIIEDKSTKTSVNIQKTKEWKNIMTKFNAITGKSRSDGELKLAWKRMKLSAKSNLSAHRMEQAKTGGGEKPPSPSPEDLEIMSIAPHDFVTEVNDYDSDAVEMQDVLDEDEEMSDWLIERDAKCGVVLHDRLMTDAALGSAPIKTEHSYSLHSDDDSVSNSPHHTKVDDMEDECYPTIPAAAWSRRRSSEPEVKAEPKSEPDSPPSSCPPSPTPATPTAHLDYVIDHTTGTIHMPQAVLQKVGAAGVPQLLLSAAPRLATSLNTNKLSIKVTSSGTSGSFNLPPTPPSSLSSSDSEGALSPAHEASAPPATAAPTRRSHLYVSHHSRQPINTPLISSQPKGSTGTLVLTEEEKRTLLAEGYPVPTRLPLTKAEEKSLKKIRRKIKNKISAQESRRKKKEYMDQLERKVEVLLSENTDYRKRVETLEQKNASLLSQLAALQALVTRGGRK